MVGTDEVTSQLLHDAEEFGVVAGGEPVVAVQEGDVFAAGRVQAGVPGGGQAAVLFVPQDSGARQLTLGAREDLRGLVARTVVDEQEFKVLAGIGRQAFQGVGRVCLHVVERHDDGELNHPGDVRRADGIRLYRVRTSR